MNDIELPNGAYHPSSEEFETPRVNRDDSPNTVSSVEQLIRVAFALGGRHNGLDLARKAVEFQQEYEQENVFSDFVVDRSRIEESNDVWLSNELQSVSDDLQAAYNDEKDVYDRRMHWYENDVIDRLQDKLSRATAMLRDGVEFKTVRVVDSDPSDGEVLKEDLAGMDISKFGYSTPITLTVCVSSDSGRMYPFVPWCGTTVCAGPTKHENPVSTLCKHEIAALLQYAEDQYAPEDAGGPDVPERFKRLMSPEDYNRFTQNIDP